MSGRYEDGGRGHVSGRCLESHHGKEEGAAGNQDASSSRSRGGAILEKTWCGKGHTL